MGRATLSSTTLTLIAALACVYVAGRLWSTTHEITYLREELHATSQQLGHRRDLAEPTSPSKAVHADDPLDVLFYNNRPHMSQPEPLQGSLLDNDPTPVQLSDGHMLGQIDALEAGVLTGWACIPGMEAQPLKVVIYVDGVEVAQVEASSADTHLSVRRLCKLDLLVQGTQAAPARGVAFKVELPLLEPGVHSLRAFMLKPDNSHKQELNQSPLKFAEVPRQVSLEQQLRRKDEIIQTRNIQIAQLWEELHTHQPWRNALDTPGKISFDSKDEVNASRKLAFIAINTAIGSRHRRDLLRKTWVPTGDKLQTLEQEQSIVVRFIVGYSEQKNDAEDSALQQEMKDFGDILRIDMVDSYDQLALKTLRMFTEVPFQVDADFYFKVDDDVAMNLDALRVYLQPIRGKPNLYLGCMKSGPVLTNPSTKWHEPESWRFGDPTTKDGAINYPRHASGQVYGLARQVARYVGKNADVLHRYANEDVSVGSWLMGLNIEYVNDDRLCCQTEHQCESQTDDSNTCVAYSEFACAGICKPEKRLEHIYRTCLEDPLHRKATQAAA